MSSNISGKTPINERVVIRMIEKEAATLMSESASPFQGFSIINLFPPNSSEHLEDFVPCIHDMAMSIQEAAVLIDCVTSHKLCESKITLNGTECKTKTNKYNTFASLICISVTIRCSNYCEVEFHIFC